MAVSTEEGQGGGKRELYFVTHVSLDPAIEMKNEKPPAQKRECPERLLFTMCQHQNKDVIAANIFTVFSEHT